MATRLALLRRLGFALLAVLALLAGVAAWLNTDSGRSFVLARLLSLDFQSGLTVEIDSLEGSLWRKAEIKGLTLGDPKGRFLKAPRVSLDWRPWRLITGKRLEIARLVAADVQMLRLPALNPRDDDRLLPDFDIRIDELKIDRLVLEAPVLGQREQMSVIADADLRAGRARLRLLADGQSGDRLRLLLDAMPERDRLQLSADLSAPAGSTLARLAGSDQPLTARLRGNGGWQRWDGRLDARVGEADLAAIDIENRKGLFRLKGRTAPALLLTGMSARLLGPELQLDVKAQITGERPELDLKLESEALRLVLRGRLLRASESIEAGTLSADLLIPAALEPRISGRDVRLEARLAGTLADPLVDWALTASEAGWGDTRLIGLRGAGIIRPRQAAEAGLALPFSLNAARAEGVADAAAELLLDPHVDGQLLWNAGVLSGDGLVLRTSRLTGSADLRFTPADANYRLALKARLPSYLVTGLGLADVAADMLVLPATTGANVTGRVTARATRLDNGGVASLLGGLPVLETAFRLAPDLSLTFTNLSLTAPDLRLSGDAQLGNTGVLTLETSGQARLLGRLTLAATGPLTAPDVRLRLARPGFGVGLAAIDARLQPVEQGWGFNITGTSNYGRVDARGRLETNTEPLTIRLESAHAIGLTASGSALASAAGPFIGRIGLNGPGLSGALVLADDAGVQKLVLNASARQASLPGTTPLLIDTGDLDLVLRFAQAGLEANAKLDFIGFEGETLRIDKGAAKLSYAAGRGEARINASGTSGIPFSLETLTRISPDEFEINGKGQIDRQQVTLSGPARIRHDGNDWVLAPVSLIAGSGKAELSGRIGDTIRLLARVDKLSLGLISAAWPRLDFSGSLSGQIDLSLPDGGVPRGRADLSVTNLSRTGVASASLPINVALNMDLGAKGTVARAIIQRAGRTEGRAQISLGPVQGNAEDEDASFMDRLFRVPVKGMARYNGPAQALWGLAGNDAIDVRGPVSLAADVNGLLGDPQLSGTLRAARARMEATILGAVIEEVALEGRFNGSRLELARFSGQVGKDGSVSGTGSIDLSAARSFPMDIRLEMKNAQLLNRDDFSGAGTGSMRIATDEYGGVVSGQLEIDRATYRLGRAAVADIPVLNVTERNVRVLGRPQLAYAPPTRWLFNLGIKGDRRLFSSGMGLEAEWRADLKILGGATTPELNGRVQLIRGDYDFGGRRFTLTRGDIRFQGGYPPDPLIDIAAESTNSGFTALLAVNGTALKPAIRFSSVPQLPEDEVLSRLLFGESVTNLSAPEAVQLAGALGSLRGTGGFNPINSVRKGLGIDRLRILPADIATGRGTAVAAGQYIGRNVYVELATDAQGYTATNIEVSITRSLSILSEVATLGGIGGNLRWKRDY